VSGQGPHLDAWARAELYARLPITTADRWWLELARAAEGPVLELGAGAGRLTAALCDLDLEVTAVERDPAMLAALRDRVGDRAEVLAADVTDLPAGPQAALVLLATSLLNEQADPAARRRLLERAASRCADGGQVALQVLGPWWLTSMPDRSVGELLPLDGSPAVRVTIEAGELDPWTARRRATLSYRFPDGALLTDRLDAAIVLGPELLDGFDGAGLRLVTGRGIEPPAAPGVDQPVWYLLAEPAPR
jgi:SAM-dependent methyltransferase